MSTGPMVGLRGGGMARPSTQHRDADLTIRDVIEADEDMAEQIAAGADQARATAEGTALMISKLEAVHAEIIKKKVPGVLEQQLLLLIDQAGAVKVRAEVIAEQLTLASEAIAVAGTNAAIRHQPLAIAAADAGHARPAEREYHDE